MLEPIDISSSETDADWASWSSGYGSDDDSSHILAPHTSCEPMPGTDSRNDESSQNIFSCKRDSAFSERSSNGLLINSNHSGEKIKDSGCQFTVGNDSSYFRMNKRVAEPGNFVDVDSLNEVIDHKQVNVFGSNVGKTLSQEALKRTLPPSLQLSHAKSKQNAGSIKICDPPGKSSRLSGSSFVNNQNISKDNFSRVSDNGMTAIDNSRMLPPSLLHGNSAPPSQFVGFSDPVLHSGTGEERVTIHDERLVYQAALQDLNQPKVEATVPAGLLSVSLFRHQKIALHWMLQKETRSTHCRGGILADDQGLGKTVSMISLIQMQRSLESKFKEEDQSNHKTEAWNLDGDDDNGISCLDKSKQSTVFDDIKVIPEAGTSLHAFRRQKPAAGTLVVCPATVLRQWFGELNEKVPDGAKLSVLIYHGGNRTKDPVKLAKYDVVLTTYSIVTNEVPKQPLVDESGSDQRDGENYGLSSEFSVNKKRKKKSDGRSTGKNGRKEIDASPFDCDSGTLAKVIWFRVILDEAQNIKNHRTQVARACWGLRAKRRWCLSGTPIQNTIDDLYSYFRFLRVDPYCVYKSFCNTIKHPISRNSARGYMKLQAILTFIMLRRTKDTKICGEPIIYLPPKTVKLSKVDFSTEERAFYLKLEAESRSKFKAYAAAGTVSQNYANILLMLLRLRQACDHPLLVKGFNSDSIGKVSVDMAKTLPMDMLVNLSSRLDQAICYLCHDPPEDAVVTICGHVFCYQCISEYLTGDGSTCPASECKEQLRADVVFSDATLRSCICDDFNSNSFRSSLLDEKCHVLENDYCSSKIRAAIEILLQHCRVGSSTKCNGNPSSPDAVAESCISGHSASQTEEPVKAIIFSQWTSMLDLVEISLKQLSIPYRRLDGTMSLVSRDRAVKNFNTDPEVLVMLMSLKAGNLGLNMVAASHVILLDLWWNPTTEDQAVDRAHRIGQTHAVTVSRITIKDTVEDRILALQEEKRKMVASAFGEDQSGGSTTRLTVEDLNYLFMASGDA